MKHAQYATIPAGSAIEVTVGGPPRAEAGYAWPQRLAATLVNWQNRASQRHHLGQLGRRELADMGMTSADADHESRKPFWRA